MGRVSDSDGSRDGHLTARRLNTVRAFPGRRRLAAPRAGIRVYYQAGVRPDVRREVGRLVAALRTACPPTHRVLVSVVPHPAIKGETGRVGFGLFQCPARGRGPQAAVRIAVAAGLADLVVKEFGDPRSQAVGDVGETFLHEWVHYEQWRSGGELTERGVRVRARNLYARLSPTGRTKAE